MTVWINGSFVEESDASVSLFDAGLQHGVGLFETMFAENAKVFRLRQHIERLCESALVLRLSQELRVDPFCEAVELALKRSALDSARIKLTLTGGGLNMLHTKPVEGRSGARPADPTIAITVQPRLSYPHELYDSGVRVSVATGRIDSTDPFNSHKTLWYWRRLRALQDAASAGCAEAIWFDIAGGLFSACVGNVLVISAGKVRAPRALPGITRNCVLDALRAVGVEYEPSPMTVDDLLGADEVFLTSSGYGVLPVVAVEAANIADGRVGPITRQAVEAYRSTVETECPAT